MDSDGTNLKQVTNNSANNVAPSLSPRRFEARRLAVDRDGNWEIYVMSVDGELAQLTDDPADDLFS